MNTQPQNFFNDESGAVTVDWVVLTAALVGLGLAVMGVISTGIQSQSEAIDSQLESDDMIRTSFSQLGTTTQLTGTALSDLQSAARDLSNTDLAAAAATARAGVDSNYDAWQAGIADGSFTDDGSGTYVDGDGNAAFTQAELDASTLASETAAVFEDEQQQRGN